MVKRIVVAFTAFALSFLAIPVANAHGEITLSVPAAGASVLTAPSEVSIEFDGKLQTIGKEAINLITVTDSQGQVISSPRSVVDGNKISTTLQLTDITGLVSVHYRIVSEDGHPVEGDYSFTVGQKPTLTSAGNEDGAEAANGISEEGGSNLKLTAGGFLIIALVAVFLVRRRKK